MTVTATCDAHDAAKEAAADTAVAQWLAARPWLVAEPATLPDGRGYIVVRRRDDELLGAARGLALLASSV